MDSDGKVFTNFERHEEFSELLRSFLILDLKIEPATNVDKAESAIHGKLIDILDEYQEQAYLLDPFLESLVFPVIERLKECVSNPELHNGSSSRIRRLCLLIYAFIKLRGYKTIIRFFPHEIADVTMVLEYILKGDAVVREDGQWAFRYAVLLWLSLICMIPFDLAQFDEIDEPNKTAMSLEAVGREFLARAGVERDAASLLLARLYMRRDLKDQFSRFLEWAQTTFAGTPDPFLFVGILQVLSGVVKSAPDYSITINAPYFLEILRLVDEKKVLPTNAVFRKFKIKVASRVGLRLLPGRRNHGAKKARLLEGISAATAEEEDLFDIPEEIEIFLEQLFSSLQDKDTIVRYSAAKGVARIAERLPSDLAQQVLETVMGLFDIHSIAAASLYDLPSLAEGTWHGACLACAEMARRGLVSPTSLPSLINWLSKALYFDIRKGAHSIGSNVRDASAYVLWALARTQNAADLAPHANDLACRLATVSLFDREIHIRRAASAAFQEYVGRTSLFLHGIDVLRKTDFFAISIRRNAFLQAAPQVAEHVEYRPFLYDHLLSVTIRHWDASMRQLAAQSLRIICLKDISALGPLAIQRCTTLLNSVDLDDLHGSLTTLKEVSLAYRESGAPDAYQQEIFKLIDLVPATVVLSPRNELVTAAACELVANAMTPSEADSANAKPPPRWRELMDFGLKHRSVMVQEAAAAILAATSRHVDCLEITSTLIRELKSGSFAFQQSLGRILGVIDYRTFPSILRPSIDCLLECVGPTSKMRGNVEARRNCYQAIPQIISNTLETLPSSALPPELVSSMYDHLLNGLNDYTIDERGDVGSWIRITCVKGLASVSEQLISRFHGNVLSEYLPIPHYHKAISGLLKQGVERLDQVRQDAGRAFMKLLYINPSPSNTDLGWVVSEGPFIRKLFEQDPNSEETFSWADGGWLFPRAVRLLEVPEYRKDVLRGLVLSIGSKTDRTHRSLSESLVEYVKSLPPRHTANSRFDAISLMDMLISHGQAHLTSNTVAIPVFQMFNVLLEGDALIGASRLPGGISRLETLLSMSTRNVDRLKSVQRIQETMKLVVHLLTVPELKPKAVEILPAFLTHQFPTVRVNTAEHMYVVFQSRDMGCDTDEVENIVLETEWSSPDDSVCRLASQRVLELLQ